MDRKNLAKRGAFKVIAAFILMALLLFLPAGTLHYGGGWLFLGLLGIPMLILGAFLLWKDPALLEKRLNAKEGERDQKRVIGLSALMFLAGFILAGLDFRFGWLPVPLWLTVTAAVLFLIGYALYAEVMRENSYLSRTVEVQAEQRVVDTGLYGIVRHPMYAATLLLFLSMPLVLGSFVSFFVFLIYPVLIVLRIRNEEKVLAAGLKGYPEYMQRVKHRLIPFVW